MWRSNWRSRVGTHKKDFPTYEQLEVFLLRQLWASDHILQIVSDRYDVPVEVLNEIYKQVWDKAVACENNVTPLRGSK